MQFRTVADAVTHAKENFLGTLVFLRSTLISAAKSPYTHPDKVYEAFAAMDRIIKRMRAASKNKKGVGHLETVFAQEGFHYHAHESQTTTGKWKEEYFIHWQGVKVSIEPHLALGKKGPENCCRIHFFAQDSGKETVRFVVAHCGRHKTNTRT